MNNSVRWLAVLAFSITFLVGTTASDAVVFGIKIEQRALDVLTLLSQRLAQVGGASNLEQVLSIKAKIVVADVTQRTEFAELIPRLIFLSRIEIFKASPGMVRVNFSSSFGDIQFLVTESESLTVIPDEGVFARTNIPEMLPANIVLPEDDSGLFTLINLLGGVPLGSLLGYPSDGTGAPDPDIDFVGELGPDDLRAIVRYRGKDQTDAGEVHVVTVGSTVNNQYIKIWVLADTMDLYQISIEDGRGTEVFIVIDGLDTNPEPSPGTFTIDTSGLTEVSEMDLVAKLMLRAVMSPAIHGPVAVDLSASSNEVARTGEVTISTNAFDLQDKEDELVCEVEHRGPGFSWTPLEKIEYAGLAPLGHWNATFAPGNAAERGLYGFRARFIDSSGNASDWLEAFDVVTVTPAPPRIVQTTPRRSETEVPVSTEISVTFSKPMDKETVESALAITSGSGRVVQGSFTWNENTVFFSPADDLQHDTTHIVVVTGRAIDAVGIGLDGNYDAVSSGTPFDDYVWTFRTSPAVPRLDFVMPLFSTEEPFAYIGDSLEVRIMGKYMTEMYGLNFKVAFDPEVLVAERVEKASFRSWRPRPKHIEEADLWSEPVIDNSTGLITIACEGTRTGGVSGAGDIATIRFRAIGADKASLEFREAVVTDSRRVRINVEIRTAEVQVVEFHPLDANHDGAVDIRDYAAAAPPGPDRFELRQNFPNPFNPETWIPYQLARPSYVTVRIFNSAGRLVRTLDLGNKEAGIYADRMKAAYWDGTNEMREHVASGVYFYAIQAGNLTANRKMLLVQ